MMMATYEPAALEVGLTLGLGMTLLTQLMEAAGLHPASQEAHRVAKMAVYDACYTHQKDTL